MHGSRINQETLRYSSLSHPFDRSTNKQPKKGRWLVHSGFCKYLSLAGSAQTQWDCYTRDRLIHIGQAKTGSLTWVMKQVNVISSLRRCRGTASEMDG